MIKISEQDKNYYFKIRENVSRHIKKAAKEFDFDDKLILDIAPEIHKGASEHFLKGTIKTLDLNPKSNADYIADLCKNNSSIIPDEYFDLIICTEVLEHTNQPFAAAKELFRILKKNGALYATTPFNFRIHNPLPDNWRFTEHGLRQLFKEFNYLHIEELTDVDRYLMPIHYTIIGKK